MYQCKKRWPHYQWKNIFEDCLSGKDFGIEYFNDVNEGSYGTFREL